jgi:hypothetical protein
LSEETEKQQLEDFANIFWKFGNTIAGFAAFQIIAVIAAAPLLWWLAPVHPVAWSR